ncbi:BTB/POZ domain-containing protein KCTD14 [Bagarius yarrelli]|uniref:BTB/POZ domain-containing protein KCTD14 n=1 Tax=Bagarius yarrelli TaxID=175774 RepID=A0A556V207_BAGYA|nr:BTB/POZ domain-containing protein KCTD14 [Bagarius yarrelli]
MSLPDIKPLRKLAVEPLQQCPVVQLNVGGQLYTTTLSTLRKYPNSKLAEMFSVPHKLLKDSEGRCFIDRDGTHFKAVLEYLRSDNVPTNNLLELHKEAVYYGIKPLVKLLEESPQLFGEKVGRQQFLSHVRNYHENLEVLIKVGKAEAMASRFSTIIMCVLKTEDDLARCNDAMIGLDTRKESIVSFGPWNAQVSVEDLLDCIRMDMEAKGYKVSIKPHNAEKGFLFKSYDFFYKLTFTWW